jgi:hypothetical protein
MGGRGEYCDKNRVSEESWMGARKMGGARGKVCGAGQGMPGTNVPGQRVRGGLGREGHGSGYKGHIGIGMVCRVGVC